MSLLPYFNNADICAFEELYQQYQQASQILWIGSGAIFLSGLNFQRLFFPKGVKYQDTPSSSDFC